MGEFWKKIRKKRKREKGYVILSNYYVILSEAKDLDGADRFFATLRMT